MSIRNQLTAIVVGLALSAAACGDSDEPTSADAPGTEATATDATSTTAQSPSSLPPSEGSRDPEDPDEEGDTIGPPSSTQAPTTTEAPEESDSSADANGDTNDSTTVTNQAPLHEFCDADRDFADAIDTAAELAGGDRQAFTLAMVDINTAQSAWFIARPDDLPAVGFDLFPIWVDVMSVWPTTGDPQAWVDALNEARATPEYVTAQQEVMAWLDTNC